MLAFIIYSHGRNLRIRIASILLRRVLRWVRIYLSGKDRNRIQGTCQPRNVELISWHRLRWSNSKAGLFALTSFDARLMKWKFSSDIPMRPWSKIGTSPRSLRGFLLTVVKIIVNIVIELICPAVAEIGASAMWSFRRLRRHVNQRLY